VSAGSGSDMRSVRQHGAVDAGALRVTTTGTPLDDVHRDLHAPPALAADTSGQFRRFTCWAIGSAALLLAVVTGVNLAADPYRMAGLQMVPAVVTSDVTFKLDLLDRVRGRPPFLVLGSSRAMKLDPAWLSGPRRPSFNAAVSGGTPVDAYAMLRRTHERCRCGFTAIWVLDVEGLRDGTIDPALVHDSRVAGYLPVSERMKEWVDALRRAASWNELQDSWRAARHDTSHDGDRKGLFSRLGYYRGMDYHWDTKFAQYVAIYANGGYPALAPIDTAYLRRTADYAADNGIRLVVVVPPMHPSLLRVIGPAGYDRRHAELLAALRDAARGRPAITVLDYRDARVYGGSNDGFLDPVHQSRLNMRAMTADICRRAALHCTVTDGSDPVSRWGGVSTPGAHRAP
jgi:hypothetical protein